MTANAGLADRSLYGGLKGDYQTTVHIGIGPLTAAPMPWLANNTSGTSFARCATPCPAYTLTGPTTTPYITVSLAHQARTIKVEAFDQVSGLPRGLIAQDEYVGRASTPGGFFTYAWDGSTSMGVQPNGTYTLRLSVLKANGNSATPADWEIWNSATVTIARP